MFTGGLSFLLGVVFRDAMLPLRVVIMGVAKMGVVIF